MRLHHPPTIDAALALLAEDGARCLAGGQSLVAMMNADLVAPASLVSLAGIAGLDRIEQTPDGGTRIGAMALHRAVAALAPRSASESLIVQAASRIGHPAIRNQGTIGGSIAHADPSADYPTALACAEAVITIAGPDGARRVPASAFFLGFFETAVAAGEMVVRIDLAPAPPGAGAHYEKFSLVDGDFGIVAVAAIIGIAGGICTHARLAIGGCAAFPVRLPAAETLLEGGPLDADALAAAGVLLLEACDPIDDFRGSAAYRLKLVPRLLARAIRAAARQADPEMISA